MSGFTKGPWFIPTTPGSKGGIAHAGGYVAFTAIPRKVNEDQRDGESWLDMRRRTDPERDAIKAEELANQKLLSAAPELYEALVKAEELFSFHEGSAKPEFDGAHPTVRINGEDFAILLADIRAALSKAAGEGV